LIVFIHEKVDFFAHICPHPSRMTYLAHKSAHWDKNDIFIEIEKKQQVKSSLEVSWGIPKNIIFDFDFYKIFFLNIENNNYCVSTMDCVIAFQRFAKLIGLPVAKSTTQTLLDLQDFADKRISWSKFSEKLSSFEKNKDHQDLTCPTSEFSLSQQTVIRLTRTERIYYLFEAYTGSYWIYLISFIRFGAIVAMIVAIIMSSLPSQKVPPQCNTKPCLGEPVPKKVYSIIQAVTLVIFLLDTLIHTSLRGFVRHELIDKRNLIDMGVGETRFSKMTDFWSRFFLHVLSPAILIGFAAVIPSLIRWIVNGIDDAESNAVSSFYLFLRSLRILSALKFLNLVSHLRHITYVLRVSMRKSAGGLFVMFLVLGIISLFIAVLALIPEGGTWFPLGARIPGTQFFSPGGYFRPSYIDSSVYEPTPFYSVPSSLGWSIAESIGQPVIAVSTAWGTILGVLMAIIGFIVLTVPIAILTNAFSKEYEKFFGIRKILRMDRSRGINQAAFDSFISAGRIEDMQPPLSPPPPIVTSNLVSHDEDGDVPGSPAIGQARKLAAASNATWEVIVKKIDALDEKMKTNKLTDSDVHEFVNESTKIVSDTIKPSESGRMQDKVKFTKLVYEIGTELMKQFKVTSPSGGANTN